MVKVRFAATVRNNDIQETWNGFYDVLKPFELRSRMEDAPVYEFPDEERAKAFIRSELPGIPVATMVDQVTRFKAPREFDEASGEYWTRTALLQRD